ncbi:MAG: hypothetical protein ABI832_18265 [bacterium]
MLKSASAVLVMLAGSVQAQEALPLLPEIMDQVQDSEVYLKGYLGVTDGVVTFALPNDGHAAFPVTIESDDDIAGMIKGCKTQTPCLIAGYGYVEWRGAQLTVFLSSIETMAAPGKMIP